MRECVNLTSTKNAKLNIEFINMISNQLLSNYRLTFYIIDNCTHDIQNF